MAAFLVHRRVLIFAAVLSWISLDPAWGATDPLASWTNGSAKQAIVGFVQIVTRPGPGFVPPAQRVAVFETRPGTKR